MTKLVVDERVFDGHTCFEQGKATGERPSGKQVNRDFQMARLVLEFLEKTELIGGKTTYARFDWVHPPLEKQTIHLPRLNLKFEANVLFFSPRGDTKEKQEMEVWVHPWPPSERISQMSPDELAKEMIAAIAVAIEVESGQIAQTWSRVISVIRGEAYIASLDLPESPGGLEK